MMGRLPKEEQRFHTEDITPPMREASDLCRPDILPSADFSECNSKIRNERYFMIWRHLFDTKGILCNRLVGLIIFALK